MNMKFYQRLTGLRQEKSLTQKELAEQLDMSRSAYSLYELGKREPDFETLQKLANFFDCTTDYLLGRTDQKKPEIIDLAAHRKDGDYSKPLSEETMKILDDVAMYIERKYANRSPEVAENESTYKPGGKTKNPD